MAKEGPQPNGDGDQYCRKGTCYDANVVVLLLCGELLKGALHEVGDHEQKSSANGRNRDPKRESKEVVSHVRCPHNAAFTCRRPFKGALTARRAVALEGAQT